MSDAGQITIFPTTVTADEAQRAGFRFGAKGTHTSRTMMFDELTSVLSAVEYKASRKEYAAAIVDNNCLAKPTTATRRLTNQRLGELYGLDPSIPIFRVFRRLWDIDESGRRLLALLCAVARDPLLASTASAILTLSDGAEYNRNPVKDALRDLVGERLNDDILDKVVRNIASSWSQSGHLEGRTFKKRRLVRATPATVAFALYLANLVGFRSLELFTSGWMTLLDCHLSQARDLAMEAKQLNLIDLRMSGDVLEINLNRLDPGMEGF
ncbi:MAG: hypothetical protein M0T70_00125 [Geobacteraceae bacterium]|nr:hypothetical protein [Geobacteraceae bacterium]